MTSFSDLGLNEPIQRALREERYETPTPIQAQTIPNALAGRDIIGIAQTGTGKTAAFALPILNRLAGHPKRAPQKSCRVLVLSPTRELSAQIMESFRTYGRHLRISGALAIGGVPMGRQVRSLLQGVDVLVATPGRLLDLIQSNALRLGDIEVFVLDEADRMLDMGFIHDIKKIITKLPKQRQSLFFSATLPKAIVALAGELLTDPVQVAVTPQATTVERIDQRVILLDRADKPSMLAEVLRGETIDRALVFTRTKHGADKVVRLLAKAGHTAEAIHGNKSQPQRERVLAAFRSGKLRTLIATDIAARGIDVDGVSHVINYDLPNVPESYVHRIGRTARAGADGVAISFCDAEERAYLRDIEKLIRLAIPAVDRRGATGGEARPQRDTAQARRHGHNGGRNGQTHQGRPGQNRHGKRRPAETGPSRASTGRERQAASVPAAAGQTGQAGRPRKAVDGAMASLPFMQSKRPPRRRSGRHGLGEATR